MEFTRKEKLKAVEVFMTEILKSELPMHTRSQEFRRQFKKYTYHRFPDFSDLWGWDVQALDDLTLAEVESLLSEYIDSQWKEGAK